jgi:hypothetical protein
MVVRKWDTSTMSFYREARSVIVSRRNSSMYCGEATNLQHVADLLQICCLFPQSSLIKRQQLCNVLQICKYLSSMEAKNTVRGKPYHSCLVPYEDEIQTTSSSSREMELAKYGYLRVTSHKAVSWELDLIWGALHSHPA